MCESKVGKIIRIGNRLGGNDFFMKRVIRLNGQNWGKKLSEG